MIVSRDSSPPLYFPFYCMYPANAVFGNESYDSPQTLYFKNLFCAAFPPVSDPFYLQAFQDCVKATFPSKT